MLLFLTDDEIDEWRNSCIQLQILQRYYGDERVIVTEVIPVEGENFSLMASLYKNANKSCGFDISDDYTKIVAGPGDDKTYFLVIPYACLLMQVIEGKPSDEIVVEYTVVDADGNVTERIVIPPEAE